MNAATANSGGSATPGPGSERRRVGTLQYTKASLVWMFVWLLQGYFVFTLMEAAAPNVVLLRLKELGISDWLLPIVMTALPNVVGMVLNPLLSTASDRHRGRWGRRIPFLLYSAPFICGALVLLAFSPELTRWLCGVSGWDDGAVGVALLAVLWILFVIMNMFTATVYYYFFNDVVPAGYMARFFGLFNMVGSAGAAIWNWFFYPHALTHMRWIFLGAAAVYLVGFTVMCLKIKEGQYPPAEGLGEGFWKKLRTYAKECCSHRLFVLMFLHNICWSSSSACGVVFLVFMYRDSLGLTLGDLGKVAAVVSVAGVVLSYPAGMLSDRYHPMRVMVWIKFGLVAVTPLNFIWLLRPTWDHATAFLILIGLNAVQLPLGILYDISRQPMQMRVWPKSRYGQFCSFAATAQGVCNIAASSLAGFFMVWMRHLLPDEKYGKDFCYRMIPAWQLPLLVAALILLLLMYREWNKLGGIKNYKVPGFDHETVAAAPEPASGAEVAG